MCWQILVKLPDTKFYEHLFSCSQVVRHTDRQRDTMMTILTFLQLFIVNMPKMLCWINYYWRDKGQDEGTGEEDIQNRARKQGVQIKSKPNGRIRDEQRVLQDTTLKFVSGWWWWWWWLRWRKEEREKEGKPQQKSNHFCQVTLHIVSTRTSHKV
jgi:hypothetical protein